jgi:hypothetical protein
VPGPEKGERKEFKDSSQAGILTCIGMGRKETECARTIERTVFNSGHTVETPREVLKNYWPLYLTP